jgi:NMD protein affecting ribosome stability and mRNA decay
MIQELYLEVCPRCKKFKYKGQWCHQPKTEKELKLFFLIMTKNTINQIYIWRVMCPWCHGRN